MTDIPIPHLERPVFFDGQRLTGDDLTDAQLYARGLRWLHNRSLHDWGVAFGLTVTGARGERSVAVAAGLALDCAGRDLILEEPVELEIPATGDAATFVLTISYADDPAVVEERGGVCGTRGAVRLADAPRLRWQDPLASDPEAAVRPGLDVILATATVEGCRLATAPSAAGRREVARPSPYAAGGRTTPATTRWSLWPNAAQPAGVATRVDTSAAGFAGVPAYQARVAGRRDIPNRAIIDGPAHIAAVTAGGFELRVVLPQCGAEDESGLPLNPPELVDDQLPALLEKALEWSVVWIGLEP